MDRLEEMLSEAVEWSRDDTKSHSREVLELGLGS